MTFLFPFPFHSHRTINPITDSDYNIVDHLKAEKYVYCVVNSKQNTKVQQKHC